MKKPRKPTDTYDIWDMQTMRSDAEERETDFLGMQDTLDSEKEKLLARLTEINDLLDTIDGGMETCRKLQSHAKNANERYMDFDEALDHLVKWRNAGKLHKNDSRVDFNCYRFDGEGRFDSALCVKAVRSIGGTTEKGLTEGREIWGIVEVPTPIAEWFEYCTKNAAGKTNPD